MHASAGAAFHLDDFPADKGDDDMPGNVIAASATGFNTISGTRHTSHKNSFKTRCHEKKNEEKTSKRNASKARKQQKRAPRFFVQTGKNTRMITQ